MLAAGGESPGETKALNSSDSSRRVPPAALYLASPEDAEAGRLDVAGLPVAFRALMSALHAGCPSVAVPAVYRGTEVDRAIGRSRPRAHPYGVAGRGQWRGAARAHGLAPGHGGSAARGAPRVAGGPARGRDLGQSARGPVVLADAPLLAAVEPQAAAEPPAGDISCAGRSPLAAQVSFAPGGVCAPRTRKRERMPSGGSMRTSAPSSTPGWTGWCIVRCRGISRGSPWRWGCLRT